MIERVILTLLTHFGTLLITEVMKRRSKKIEVPIAEDEIDKKLSEIKTAYRNAFDGTPVTPEQKRKINEAISSFVRGADGSL